LKSSIQTTLSQGLAAGWPICLGYLPIGIAFGILAQKAGLHPVEIGMMSLFVFAGSSQFVAVSMISSGATAVSIIITIFMINLRHLLMSSVLAIYLKRSRRRLLLLFAYGVTDESFAVNLSKFTQGGWGLQQALVVNHVANITWIAGTVFGGYAGRIVPAHAFGIDYALIAMFICLLVFQVKGPRLVWIAVLSGTSAVALSLVIPGNSHIVLASAFAATCGLVFNRLRRGNRT